MCCSRGRRFCFSCQIKSQSFCVILEIGEYRMIVNSVFDPAWDVTAGMTSEDPAQEDFGKDDGLPEGMREFVFSDIA